jgi:hypothetical protein
MLVAMAKTSRSCYYEGPPPKRSRKRPFELGRRRGSRAKGELVVKEAFEGLAQLR